MHKKKGKDINNYHYHEDCIEVNAVVKGKFLCNNKLIQENDIFVFNKNVPSICEFLEDCTFVVFKNKPSTTDKVLM